MWISRKAFDRMVMDIRQIELEVHRLRSDLERHHESMYLPWDKPELNMSLGAWRERWTETVKVADVVAELAKRAGLRRNSDPPPPAEPFVVVASNPVPPKDQS